MTEIVASDLQRAAEAAATTARELADETEGGRRLPEGLLSPLRASGLLRAGVPVALGGPEAAPATTLRAAETVARGDASAGWCVSIAATSSLLAAHLPPEGGEEIFRDPATVAAGVWAPRGKADAEDGGYRVSGRWPFCSGIDHSDWLFAGCLTDGGLVIAALPKADLEILDTWRTAGLRGTGSHDCVATGAWVPAHRTLSLLDGGPVVDAPLYRFPIFGFFALSIAAAALGNARGALDDLAALATAKTTPSGRTLAGRSATQAAIGEAEAALRAARGLFYGAIDEAWTAAQDPGPVGTELRLGLRLAATHAVRTSAEIARAMYDLGGGTAIYDTSPLQRRFRDAHTATAHFQVNPATWELAGRLLLGVPADTGQL
jgi:indole-3-acetate monooxygenase